MPICIECRFPVQSLYTVYSKADDRLLGKGVRLTQCPRCKRFADKYVEHDFVVLFIDLVLIKPQVYRHLLFNRLGRVGDEIDPSIFRFGLLLLLFDVYLTWARIEKAYPQTPLPASPLLFGTTSSNTTTNTTTPSSSPQNLTDLLQASTSTATTNLPPTHLTKQPILIQYTFFLLLCSISGLAFHLPIRLLSTHALPLLLPLQDTREDTSSSSDPHSRCYKDKYKYPNRISTALLVSSITKLFPILMVVWDYDLPSSASAVAWAVIANNVAALEILLDCGWVASCALVGVGAGCRAGVAWGMLRAVGLEMGRLGAGGERGGGGGMWEGVVGLFGLV